MEDKSSSKESHVWTLSDFIERRKDWDQRDEARLAEYLQQLSNKITQGAKNTLNELDDLVASIDDTAVQVANINNEFQLLADKQFIENKVQEEDETVQLQVEKPVAHEINDANILVNNIKEALKNSFKAVDNHFEKITVVVSDSDDDELKHEETILRPKIFYKKLNLPSLSGNTQSEIPIDSMLSSDSDVETPPMDSFKKQESFSSDDVPEEDVHFINESKSTVEPIHQTVENYSNITEPEKFKPKNISPDTVYVENDLFSPPPLINDNDEDDLVNEYNMFSNGSNMFGERNLWGGHDDDEDDDADFEPPLPIYTDEPPLPIHTDEPPLPIHTDEPPQQIFKSNIQEKVPSIQQTLNDELRKRFQKDNISSSLDKANEASPITKLPTGAVNVLCGTDSKSAAEKIKQATISQISKQPDPIQYNTVSEVKKEINISNKLFGDTGQNSETFTHNNLKEEIKPIKKQSLFEQESDDDLFAEKIPNVITSSKIEEPKQRENSVKTIKESNTIFSESDEQFTHSKSTTKETLSHSIDNKSTTLLDSSSDDDLFNIKSSNNKSILKQKLDQIKHESQSHVKEKNNKELLNKEITIEPKNNYVEPSVTAYNEITKKESIRNNNTLSTNTTMSSMNNKSKKLSYLFSSDEDDDIFFDAEDSNKNRKKSDQLISKSTKSVKNRNEKRHGLKVELFDSSSDDEIFITNKSNNNFISKKNNKPSLSKHVESISKSLDDHDIINETKNEDNTNMIEKKLTDKIHTNVFSLESDEDNDDNLSYNANIPDGSKILISNQNTNDKMKSISLSSDEYFTPTSKPQYEDIFGDFPSENILNSTNQKSFNEKEMDVPQNETFSSSIGNANKENTSIFSSSDDEQQLSFSSTIHNVNQSSEIKDIQSNLDSLSENLPIVNNEEVLNVKEINSSKNETSPTFTENIIQDKKSSILSSSDDRKLSLNSNTKNDDVSNTEIKLISPTLDSSPANLPVIKKLESLNEKKISTALNKASSSSSEIKILDTKSSIFSSSEDEQKVPFNSNIQNEKSSTNKVIGPTFDSKISLNDSTDGSSFSSPNSKTEIPKKIPGKLSVNAGAFINVASLLPNSKNPITKSKISQTVASDEKITETLPTSGTKLYSAERERARIQVKRRPPSRKARQLAISQMSSIDIDHDQETNLVDSSRLNVSTSLEIDFVDNKSSPMLQKDNLEVQNNTQTQPSSKLVEATDDMINVKTEKNNEIKKKSVLELFDDDSDPFETMTEDKNIKDFLDDKIEIQIGENKLESKLLIDQQHSDNAITKKEPKIESENKNLPETESKHNKLVKALNVEDIEKNDPKLITQSTILPTKSNSLFNDEEDLFSVKSEKVIKSSSNIFDSDDEFEFSHKFTKKTPVKTKSIFGDDSDDDLFSTPSKPSTSNLSNQKQMGNLSQRQNRSNTDGYVKLTAESVAINPLDESKNN